MREQLQLQKSKKQIEDILLFSMMQQPRPVRRFYRETQFDPQNPQTRRQATGNSNPSQMCTEPSCLLDPSQHRNHIQAEQQTPTETTRDPRAQAEQRRRQQRQEAEIAAQEKRWLDGFIDKKMIESQTRIDTEEGIPVYFPKIPYEQQERYINQMVKCLNRGQIVTNAFMESPTGTGKTLCNLASALAWIFNQRKHFRKRHRVLYISRTHSQLQQVIKQLKGTCYRPTMTIMGSKDHLCINTDIDLQQTKGVELRQVCKEKVNDWYKLKRNNNLNQEEKASLALNACRKYGDKYHTINIGKGLKNKIFSNQEIKQIANQNGFCPSFYSFYMQQYCDLIVMPYNYLLDVGILQRYSHLIKDSILIFDQAHNVAANSCNGRSFHYWDSFLKGLSKDLTHMEMNLKANASQQEKLRQARAALEDDFFLNQSSISILQQNIDNFLNLIDFHLARVASKKYHNDWYKIFETEKDRKYTCVIRSKYVELSLVRMIYGLTSAQIKEYKKYPATRQKFLDRTIESLDKILRLNADIHEGFNQIKGAKFYNMLQVNKILGRIQNLLSKSRDNQSNLYNNQILHYCIVINIEVGGQFENEHFDIKKYDFSLNCLVPWFTFGEIQAQNPHSIIFSSGTMSPLEDWTNELNIKGIPFSNKHVISPRQIKLNVLTHDIRGKLFDFTFSHLQTGQIQNGVVNKRKHYLSLMETISAIAQNVPGGILVILPSYSMQDSIQKYLENWHDRNFHRVFQKIQSRKKQFFEAKGTTEPVDQYKRHIQNGNEGVLYCVCRGKASQGVDFPDNLCRAVIFVGIPFPNIHEPLINEKMLHYRNLAKKSKDIPQLENISWNTYFFNQTIRALNQGLGRVIRHKYDYGQIFLLDSRYSPQFQKYAQYKSNEKKKKIHEHLPSWADENREIWGDSVDNIQRKISELRRFYEWNAANTRAPNN